MLSKNHELWMQVMRSNNSKLTGEDFRLMLNKYAGQIDADVSANHQSILMTASSLGNLKLVEELLKMSASISRKDGNGRTALHYAASVGAISIFELLVHRGADVDSTTIGGDTPLMRAALFSQANIMEWYLNNSPESFKKVNSQGETALDILRKLNKPLEKEVRNALESL